MKSSTRLDSAVFQLTPTRTRCDLLVSANGKTVKIASGLLNPFLAHLKTAQEQAAKGGYSIVLKPAPADNAYWFTKGTIQRFVRFVSNPEILERVYTIESEILQMQEAIAIQSNSDMGSTAVETKLKLTESIEGSRPVLESNEEKAIVLYEPSSLPAEANGSPVVEENSKVQVIKVLETRKTALQKEQGMAFARAVAAGFDIDEMDPLMLFAKAFGASRLMDACVKFMDSWKRKHETGQWIEIEAMEAMSAQPDISPLNATGIVFASGPNTPESDVKSSSHASPGMGTNSPIDSKQNGQIQGQFSPPMFPPWPIHSPPGTFPMFQGYPMEGMPYYTSYPGNSPYQSPYVSVNESKYNSGKRSRWRNSMDSKEADSENEEIDDERLCDGIGVKGHRSHRKRAGMVVIRNINYVNSKKKNSSLGDSQSGTDTEVDEENEGNHKRSQDNGKSADTSEVDNGQWQAFQSLLLRDASDEDRAASRDIFSMERESRGRRRRNIAGDDPLVFDERDMDKHQQRSIIDMENMTGNSNYRCKGSNDELMISRRHGQNHEQLYDNSDFQVADIDGKKVMIRRTGNEEFVIQKRENLFGLGNSTDPLAINCFDRPVNAFDKRDIYSVDDSYIVARFESGNETGDSRRNAIDIGSEISSLKPTPESLLSRVNYEPDDLSMVPERGTERRYLGPDPLDDELQAQTVDNSLQNKGEKIGDTNKGSKKLEKSRGVLDKKKVPGPIRKGRPSKMNPLDEARARADRVRSFKADLQKMKKEKEEEEMKRIEALKLARQKRIAARSSVMRGPSPLPSQQTRKSLPTKLSPVAFKGSKFTDSEPKSPFPSQQTRKSLPTKLSPNAHKGSKFTDSEPKPTPPPLQGLPVRNVSLGSSVSQKASKPSKPRTNSSGNRLTQSVPSLHDAKKTNSVMPETRASTSKPRRLSESKISNYPRSSLVKQRGALSSMPASDGSESKKISEILSYDKTKAASLPELKIKTTKSLSPEETVHKVDDIKSLQSVEKDDDALVVEKTVVMLERGKPSDLATIAIENEESEYYDGKHTGPDHATIHSLGSSPLSIKGVVTDSSVYQPQANPSANDIILAGMENPSDAVVETPKFPAQNVDEKPFQAPYAYISPMDDSSSQDPAFCPSPQRKTSRNTSIVEVEGVKAPYACLSSLEDSLGQNFSYGIEPQIRDLVSPVEPDAIKPLVSEMKSSKLEKTAETSDRNLTKEGAKGLRRLLKFGRKGHSAGASERKIETDAHVPESADRAATSSEAYTLKNLISQGENPTEATSHKSSRNFSLLSPFKNKPNESKVSIQSG